MSCPISYPRLRSTWFPADVRAAMDSGFSGPHRRRRELLGGCGVLWKEDTMATAKATGYCMKCKTQREIKNGKPITMKNGRPATQGTCSVCSTKMFKIGAAK
jgi:uncharacterized protein DUF5679